MKSVTYYPFTLNAGATLSLPIEGDYFRIQSATGAIDVTVDGVGTLPDLLNGQGLKNVPFKRLTLKDKSGATNTGFILVAFDEFIDNRTYGVNDLSAGTLSTIRQPLANTGFFQTNAAIAANTAETVLSPGSNVNGCILLNASASFALNASTGVCNLMAKASAPANAGDGMVLMSAFVVASLSPTVYHFGKTDNALFVPAGLGLYFITPNALAADANTNNFRSARFRLL